MKRKLSLLLVIGGGAVLAWGLWIPAKAQLAQLLIARAWERTMAGDADARPWSWADTRPVARLRVPRLREDLYVLDGISGRTLAFGPGHLERSARPGEPGNVVLAGHRDTHFAFLRRVVVGDRLELQDRRGSWHRYVVVEATVVDESRGDLLEATSGDVMTLVTCYPFDAVRPGGPLRFVLRARAA